MSTTVDITKLICIFVKYKSMLSVKFGMNMIHDSHSHTKWFGCFRGYGYKLLEVSFNMCYESKFFELNLCTLYRTCANVKQYDDTDQN